MKTIRNIAVGTMLILLSHAAEAAEAAISKVVVYRNGAEITHESSIQLTPGNQEVVLSQLTSTIDANSLQVKVFGNATLLSASVRTNFMGYQTLPERTRQISDSLVLIKDQISWLASEQAVNQGEMKLLEENQRIVNEKTVVTATDVAQLAKMYRGRMTEIRKMMHEITIEQRKLNEVKTRLEKQLAELQHQRGKRMGEAVLNMHSAQAAKVRVRISYLTRNAGWNPVYDLRCESVSDPVDLVYKANIFQTTGFDWEKVNLTVSTGNPTANNQRPVLSPWFIDFVQYNTSGYLYESKAAAPAAKRESNLMIMADEVAESELVEQAPVPYHVDVAGNQMSTAYTIDASQTIPSDGKEHIVPIQEYELAASYSYHAVPKLSPYGFLLARIGDYNEYSLLPGNANVFFEGLFVGQTYLNPQTTSDSLIVSLGRDESITVERNTLRDFTASKVIGGNQRVTKGYEIVVRNNKKQTISMEILDQVPIPRNKEIEVEIDEMSGASYQPDYGKLLWKVNLQGGESRKYRLIYTVKYPKDREIPGI